LIEKCELTHTWQEKLTPGRRLNRPALPREIFWRVERSQVGSRAGRAENAATQHLASNGSLRELLDLPELRNWEPTDFS
jgi:hypothetical protein